jgi:hypothetical protein
MHSIVSTDLYADGTISAGEHPELKSSVAELCGGLEERDEFCRLDADDYLPPE